MTIMCPRTMSTTTPGRVGATLAVRGRDARATHGGVNVRRGTDYYQLDGGETIQPELINMCRWILSWFGGDCCGKRGRNLRVLSAEPVPILPLVRVKPNTL